MKPDSSLVRKQEVILCQTAALAHAFSHQHRLKIVSLLTQSTKSVEALAKGIGQSVASTSAHLKVLRSAGAVTSHKTGRYVYYQLGSNQVPIFLVAIRRLAEELLPEVREIMRDYFDDPESLSPLTERELLAEIKTGRVIVLDLRPEDEFAAGHIPGASSIPCAKLKEMAKQLPSNARFVAYCRGPYCLMAKEGTESLRSLGYNVHRLRFGTAEWRTAGQTLEHGSPMLNT